MKSVTDQEITRSTSFAVQHSHESRLARTSRTTGAINYSLVRLYCFELPGCVF